MHSFAHHHHGDSGEALAKATKGLILNLGWRYDLTVWFFETFMFRGKWRELRQRTATLASIQVGEAVLDVGCRTESPAVEVQYRVGATGRVCGVDPAPRQIARARSKAARRNVSIEFQIGVIEDLLLPNQTFDVALSTIMMHHLPKHLRRQRLSEIARVLKPGGLAIADFKHKQERQGQAARFHAGGAPHARSSCPREGSRFFYRSKRRRCRSHDSLRSWGQALSGHTKADTSGAPLPAPLQYKESSIAKERVKLRSRCSQSTPHDNDQ